MVLPYLKYGGYSEKKKKKKFVMEEQTLGKKIWNYGEVF